MEPEALKLECLKLAAELRQYQDAADLVAQAEVIRLWINPASGSAAPAQP